eukprot:SAG31_NODE_2041_length_6590_cov_2.334155_5_plen_154_part_00
MLVSLTLRDCCSAEPTLPVRSAEGVRALLNRANFLWHSDQIPKAEADFRTVLRSLLDRNGVLDLQAAFQGFDHDGDGKISSEEFATGLQQLQQEVTNEQTELMVTSIDRFGNGSIDFEKFAAWAAMGKSQSELIAAFVQGESDSSSKGPAAHC